MTSKGNPRRAKGGESRRESLLADYAMTPVSDAERRRAALAVCRRCTSVEEARELLEALGLLDPSMARGAA